MRHSIRRRLIFAFFGLAVVPLLLAGLTSTILYYNHYTETELQHLRELSLRVATQVEQVMRRGEEDLGAVQHYRHFLALPAAAQEALLSELVTTHSYIREVALLDREGRERVRVSGDELVLVPRDQLHDERIYRTALARGNAQYGDIAYDANGEPSLSFAVPVINRLSGEADAVLLAELRLKHLWDLVARLERAPEVDVYVVDETRRVIAHRNPSVVLRATELPAEGDSLRTGLTGQKVFMVDTAVVLGGREFRVVAEHDWREATSPLFEHLLVLSAVLLVAFLVALLAGAFVLRRVVRPVLQVEATARAIAAGDMDQRVPVQGTGEIAELARSFNDMTDHLQRTLGELQSEMSVRTQAEQALRDSEQRFRQLAENIQEVFWLTDWPSNRVVYVSPAFEQLWEISAERLYREPMAWTEAVVPDDRPLVEQAFLSAAEQGGFDVVYRITRREGKERWIHDRAFVVRDAQDRPYRLAGVAQDVTERITAEERLRATRQMLQLVIDTMPLHVFWKDREARYLGCNESFASSAGLSDSRQIVGKSDYELSWRDQADLYRADDFRVMESGEPKLNFVEPQTDATGARIWLLTSKVPLRDVTGRVVGVLGMYQDITAQKDAEAKLQQAAAEWNYAMDFYDDPIYLIDLERRVVRANRAFYAMVGRTEGEVIGRHIVDLIHPAGEEEPCPVCRMQVDRRDGIITLEADHSSNPAGVPIEVIARVIRDGKMTPSGILMTIRDLSRVRRTEERLRQAAAVFESTQEGVVITDSEAVIVAVNRAFTQITGYAENEVLGRKPSLLASGRHDSEFFRTMWSAMVNGDGWRGEIWNRRKNGEIYPEWLNVSVVRDTAGKAINYVGVFSDISVLKLAQERLEFLAHHDPLTDLPNRLLLWSRLQQAMQRSERNGASVALLFLDLDRFKHVNDSLGHTVGDTLLQAVAKRLMGLLRREDTVARLGGDEFTVVLEGVDDHQAVLQAQKIIQRLGEPFVVQDRELYLGASIGISLYPRDGKTVEVLLRNADAAMYRAKEAGRNTYRFYTEEMTEQAFERVTLERELRRAVERSELVLHYQPQFDLRTGALSGLEVLVRWEHPEQGLIAPVRFIPLAEENGLIIPLGEWVLREACRQGAAWLEQGIEFGRIAVNVAGPQIQRGDLVTTLKRALAESGLPAERLELEITETFVMGQAAQAADVLHRIRSLGVNLSIDDFGTGYSSLAYLKRLPFNKIKIDRSFIRDLPHDENDAAIARAVIAIGHSLQFVVIAEGVENAEQRGFLVDAGCEQAQGYFYARPAPAAEFASWLQAQLTNAAAAQ